MLSVGGLAIVELTSGPGGVTPVLVAMSDGGELIVLALIASFILGRSWEQESTSLDDDPAFVLDRAIIDLERTTSSAGEGDWPEPNRVEALPCP